METCNSGELFEKKRWFLLQECQLSYFYLLKMNFYKYFEPQILITMKNSQLTIEKKIYVKFAEGFSGIFCINITWHYGNLNVKCFIWWYPLK